MEAIWWLLPAGAAALATWCRYHDAAEHEESGHDSTNEHQHTGQKCSPPRPPLARLHLRWSPRVRWSPLGVPAPCFMPCAVGSHLRMPCAVV
jgi:hypothetical protein